MSLKQFLNFTKKILCNGGLFILLAFFTYRLVFSRLEKGQFSMLLSQVRIGYILCGFCALLLMLGAEAYNIKRNLHLLNQAAKYSTCLVYAFAGNFFSGITPAASGGQPMQLYLMYKNKIPASKATLALFMDLGAYQAVITGLGVLGYIGYSNIIHRSLGKFVPVLWLGLVINTGLLALTFCAMFSDKFIYKLVSFAAKIIGVFSKKKAATFSKAVAGAVEKYKEGAAVLKQNMGQYFLNSGIMLLRIIAMHSAPYWVYRALGFSQTTFFEMIALQSVLYIFCAALPFPGSVGIGESIFLLYFKEIFPAGLLSGAMALSRGLGVYATIGFSGIALMLIWILKIIKKISLGKGGKSYRLQTPRS